MLSEYDKIMLSPSQQSIIQRATELFKAAKGDKQKEAEARNMANAIRESAGYNGGYNGTQFIRVAVNTVKSAVSNVSDTVQRIVTPSVIPETPVTPVTPVNPSTVIQNPIANTSSVASGSVNTIPVSNTDTIIPAPMDDNLARIIKMFLVVLGIGLVASIFRRR